MKPKNHRSSLFYKLRTRNILWNAWRTVYRSASNSQSTDIKSEAVTFSENLPMELRKIQRDLLASKYVFRKARAVKLPRINKKRPRPLTIPVFRDRIVQRAMLDVLQSTESIKSIYTHTHSFGGIPEDQSENDSTRENKRGVRAAIKRACELIHEGYTHYIKSDIRDFFTRIPRSVVHKNIQDRIQDQDFLDTLDLATSVEFENLAYIREDYDLFPQPGSDIGAAQGICLSPLFGNVLLSDFDRQMNTNEFQCLRYIDDILILAKSHSNAWKGFKHASRILKAHDMTLYHPDSPDARGKALSGVTKKALEYLGCRLNTDFVMPNRDSQKSLIQRINEDLKSGRNYLISKSYKNKVSGEHSFAAVLSRISTRTHAWGRHYSFCNCGPVFDRLDRIIQSQLDEYIKLFFNHYSSNSDYSDRRAMIGIVSLRDLESKPIYPLPSTSP